MWHGFGSMGQTDSFKQAINDVEKEIRKLTASIPDMIETEKSLSPYARDEVRILRSQKEERLNELKKVKTLLESFPKRWRTYLSHERAFIINIFNTLFENLTLAKSQDWIKSYMRCFLGVHPGYDYKIENDKLIPDNFSEKVIDLLKGSPIEALRKHLNDHDKDKPGKGTKAKLLGTAQKIQDACKDEIEDHWLYSSPMKKSGLPGQAFSMGWSAYDKWEKEYSPEFKNSVSDSGEFNGIHFQEIAGGRKSLNCVFHGYRWEMIFGPWEST